MSLMINTNKCNADVWQSGVQQSSLHKLFCGVRDEAGHNMVEFALTAMILLTITFGMIDFSRAVYAASVVQAAAQEGARAGIVDGDVTAAINDKLIGLNPGNAIITINNLGPNLVEVNITYDFAFLTPIISSYNGGHLDLQGSAQMIRQ